MARILVIDDIPNVRALLGAALQNSGHEVHLARNGAQGLSMLRQWPAELILCDLLMPDKEGIETIKELVTQQTRPPVIAMSGDSNLLHVAKKMGAKAILRKPFDLDALLCAVDEAMVSIDARMALP